MRPRRGAKFQKKNQGLRATAPSLFSCPELFGNFSQRLPPVVRGLPRVWPAIAQTDGRADWPMGSRRAGAAAWWWSAAGVPAAARQQSAGSSRRWRRSAGAMPHMKPAKLAHAIDCNQPPCPRAMIEVRTPISNLLAADLSSSNHRLNRNSPSTACQDWATLARPLFCCRPDPCADASGSVNNREVPGSPKMLPDVAVAIGVSQGLFL